jgi:hypothetical protein
MYRVVLLAVLLAVLPARADDAKPGLRAGAFAMNVTPEAFPISVNGGMADRQATKANDPLHARCLVLDDGKTRLAIVVVDSCMIPRELIDAAKARAAAKTGIPASNMLVSATHTHSAPTVGGVFQSDPDAGYMKFLTAKIAEGIEKAHARLAPAEAGWGVVKEPSELHNRRWRMKDGVANPDPFGRGTDRVKMNPGYQNPGLLEPAGPIDPDVSVLSVRTTDGKPLVLLANYSLHYVGDLPPLSADYFGVFADRVGGLIGAGEGFVGILSNGTSGDVNNIDYGKAAPLRGKPGDRCRAVAETVAKAAKKAYDSIKHRRDLTLAAAEEELELRVRKPTDADVTRARSILAKAQGRPLKGVEEVYARETVLLADYPDAVKMKLQAMRVGELGIAAIPCEVFTEIGLAIKKGSPLKPTFTIELANGYNGYLPTPVQHKLGGYETWRARSSYLEVEASDKIVPVVLRLLGKVAGK